MKRLNRFDHIMLASVIILCVLSVVMVASASMSISQVRYGSSMRIVSH